MENFEDILNVLEEFERTKPKDVPKELEEFIAVVAKTGDPIYPWPKIKLVYRTKIVNVLAQFFEAGPSTDTNTFSFESMRTKILERFDMFRSAPFTIQRLSELLINPRKEYNRIDKFMRALEKNILVVSVAEPGCSKHVHLNGSVELMDEGFQVSTASVYEEYRQRVAGIMENEAAAATISEGDVDRKIGESRKGEELRAEERDHVPKRAGPRSSIAADGGTSTQTRLTRNHDGVKDNQDFQRLEFSIAETDTLAIVEIVSEVDCPPESAEGNEDSGKGYDNTLLSHESSEANETAVNTVISEVANSDSVTEVVATETVGSASVVEDLVPTDNKMNEADKPVEESLCLNVSPSKDATPSDNVVANDKVDSHSIDVIDIGSSVDVHRKGESDSGLSTPAKVLVISSADESGFPGNLNCSSVCKLQLNENNKDELSYVGADKNQSASQKPSGQVDGDVSKPTAALTLETVIDSKSHHPSPQGKSSSSECDATCDYNEECANSVKTDNS